MEGREFGRQFQQLPNENHPFQTNQELVLGTTTDDEYHVGVQVTRDIEPIVTEGGPEFAHLQNLEVRYTVNDLNADSEITTVQHPWVEQLTNVAPDAIGRSYDTLLGDLVLPWGETQPPTIGGREIGDLQLYYFPEGAGPDNPESLGYDPSGLD